ncbi:MAG: endonuclease V [Candidatus Bathyarchaeia archaeon]
MGSKEEMEKNSNQFFQKSIFEKIEKHQEKLAELVIKKSKLKSFKKIAGADVTYFRGMGICSALNFNIESLSVIDKAICEMKIDFPYIPGFLAFHEGPIIVKTIRKLSIKPDVLLVDGHGIAHPRKCGLASFVGILLNMPTVGVAKEKLYGRIKGNRIYDEKGEVIGAIVKPSYGKKLLYVSIGHMVSLNDAIKIVLMCTVKNYPEPLKMAHEEVKRIRESMLNRFLN